MPSPNTLTAYRGGSGMWSIRNASGTRSYSAELGRRGLLLKLTNRRGAPVSVKGPTADEVYRAIRRARETEQAQLQARAADPAMWD